MYIFRLIETSSSWLKYQNSLGHESGIDLRLHNLYGTWTAPVNEDDIVTIIQQHNEKSHTADSIMTRLINKCLEAIAV